MTTRAIPISAPTTFIRGESPEEILSYDMELLTPMLGGGVKSWQPDFNNLIRLQAIKGHLRFWWRTMQHCTDEAVLREQEDALWGSTKAASKVKLSIIPQGQPTVIELRREGNYIQYGTLPGYVLFPLQGQTDRDRFAIITDQKFQLTIHCRSAVRETVNNAVKLWILFGGLGARTRRGCGSISCRHIMGEFSSPMEIAQFIRSFQSTDNIAWDFTFAPYPQLQNCRFAWRLLQGKGDAKAGWEAFLSRYGEFRQKVGIARNISTTARNRPGRTRWPEADAIRRLTGSTTGLHSPTHHAGNWFPRGAYGLPIQTEFRNEHSDPQGKFMLQPKDYDRWPSPVILKVIKFSNGDILETCLILNHSLPGAITLKGQGVDHILADTEKPLAFSGKVMPANAPLKSGTSPYEGLIKFLKLTEDDHDRT